MEKRSSERDSLRAEVMVCQPDQRMWCYSRDLSGGGIFIETVQGFAVGDEIRLLINNRGAQSMGSTLLNVSARVVRVVPQEGIGAAFTLRNPAGQTEVRHFVSNLRDSLRR